MRHLAWLLATPERAPQDKSVAPLASRLQQLRKDQKDDDYWPEMPPLEAGQPLLDLLLEIGPALAGGMGPAPLTHAEIRAWQANCGVGLLPWEARLLHRLSVEFVHQSHEAERRDCPPPWQAAPAVRMTPSAAELKSALRALAQL